MKLIGIVLYLLILLLIGAVASRRMQDLRDYYAGGKRFGFWAAAFSSRATGESAWLLIGLTGMVGRAVLVSPSETMPEQLGQGGQQVLPLLVAKVVPAWAVGVYIAIVLAAIMSTVDSLLVLASSAFVRDYYQKVRHPDMSDQQLLGRSRTVTFLLATVALAIAFTVAAAVPGRTVFWFAIFGWSGISATFCPTMILSLFWSRLTARGALAAMLSGFASVPFFKLVAPQLPWVGGGFEALSELPPAFIVSGIVAIVVSLLDQQGMRSMAGVGDELVSRADVPTETVP